MNDADFLSDEDFLSEQEREIRLSALREWSGKSDADIIAMAENFELPPDPPYGEWLILLNRANLIESEKDKTNRQKITDLFRVGVRFINEASRLIETNGQGKVSLAIFLSEGFPTFVAAQIGENPIEPERILDGKATQLLSIKKKIDPSALNTAIDEMGEVFEGENAIIHYLEMASGEEAIMELKILLERL